MELNQIKYILEIYKTGSISKASHNLYVSQPYLSACLRKFEESIGFCIFERHNKGVSPTTEGKQVLQDLLSLYGNYQFIKQKYHRDHSTLQTISISARRSSYIAFAISEAINEIQDQYDSLSVRFIECTNNQVIEDISNGNADLGIIRFFDENKEYFDTQLKARHISAKTIMTMPRKVLMAKSHPLADQESILKSSLVDYPEIIHGDFETDNMSLTHEKLRLTHASKKLIQVYERASLLDLVSSIEGSYAWTNATHPSILNNYNLVEKTVQYEKSISYDYIIYKEKYPHLTLLNLIEEKIQKVVTSMHLNHESK